MKEKDFDKSCKPIRVSPIVIVPILDFEKDTECARNRRKNSPKSRHSNLDATCYLNAELDQVFNDYKLQISF